jgi:CRP/FNR family transcriptional regulator
MAVASELRLGEPPRVAGGGLAQIDLAALANHAAVLRTRRGQSIALTAVDPDATFLIRSGFHTLECALPGTEPHIVALLLPGDVLRSSHLPPRCDTALQAHASGEIFRLRSATTVSLAMQMPALARHLEDALARYLARQALHEIALAQFDCAQKVATFLIELAARSGLRTRDGIRVEVPLGRKEIADYLGINPDTLSRVMSRLRSWGWVELDVQRRAVIRDLDALTKLSPAGASLLWMHNAEELVSLR